jgi:small subunit ribosomal protein S16
VAVKIRLKRMGKIRTPFYRIVVADSRTKRDGRVIEEIGTYNPKADPSIVTVVSERAQYWLGVGAQPTEAVAALFKLTGDIGGKNTLKFAEEKRSKEDIFQEALKELHSDAASAATTKKAAAKKAAAAKDDEPKDATTAKKAAPKAEKPKADEAPADEAKADEAKADEAKADEAKVEDAPAEDAKAAEPKAEDAPAEDTKPEDAPADEAKA